MTLPKSANSHQPSLKFMRVGLVRYKNGIILVNGAHSKESRLGQ